MFVLRLGGRVKYTLIALSLFFPFLKQLGCRGGVLSPLNREDAGHDDDATVSATLTAIYIAA